MDKWLENKNYVNKLNSIAEHVLKNYKNEKSKGVTAGDTIICMNIVKKDQYSIFPTVSKVRNLGHDGSGEHCGITDRYIKQEIDDGSKKTVFPKYIEPNYRVNKILRQHFKPSLKHRVIRIFPKKACFMLRCLRC